MYLRISLIVGDEGEHRGKAGPSDHRREADDRQHIARGARYERGLRARGGRELVGRERGIDRSRHRLERRVVLDLDELRGNETDHDRLF
jgi:hypothetical protein